MRVFMLPESYDGGPSLVLSGKEAHRLTSVLRLGSGAAFDAVDREGRPFRCVVIERSTKAVKLSVAPRGLVAETPSLRTRFVLVQGLPKTPKMDLIVRQAVEAGVSRIIPVATERSIPRAEGANRVERWLRIAREALQQSGASVFPLIDEPLSLDALPSLWTPGADRLGLFFHEAPLASKTLHGYLSCEPSELAVCVGPEGGFSEGEVAFLKGGGYEPAWLGPNVLRCETAALYAVAAASVILLERGSWSSIR